MNEQVAQNQQKYALCIVCWKKQGGNPPLIGEIKPGGDVLIRLWPGRAGTQLIRGENFEIMCQSCQSTLFSKKQSVEELDGRTVQSFNLFGFFIEGEGEGGTV